jgi:hypothetical protein
MAVVRQLSRSLSGLSGPGVNRVLAPVTALDGIPVTLPHRLAVSAEAIRGLDLSPLAPWIERPPAECLAAGPVLELDLQWPRAADDPRELSECPEPRLWSLRLDACNPWLPLVLERTGGQLTRHVAMLLPHGFSRAEGVRFAPESLELWITHRLFLLDHLARREGLQVRQGLGQMAAVLGFRLDEGFWELADRSG